MIGKGRFHRPSLVRRGEFTCHAVRWVYTMSCAWCGAILKREANKKSVYVAYSLASVDGWIRRKDGWKCKRCVDAGAAEVRRRTSKYDGQGRRRLGVTRDLVRELSLEGLSSRKIAAKLKIGLRTVQTHRKILRERGELRYFDERAKGPFARSGGAEERQ